MLNLVLHLMDVRHTDTVGPNKGASPQATGHAIMERSEGEER